MDSLNMLNHIHFRETLKISRLIEEVLSFLLITKIKEL
jgi:hypothetical protein